MSVTSHIVSERAGPTAVAQSNKGCKTPVPAWAAALSYNYLPWNGRMHFVDSYVSLPSPHLHILTRKKQGAQYLCH